MTKLKKDGEKKTEEKSEDPETIEEEDQENPTEETKEPVEETTPSTETNQVEIVEEVGILQNDGIFRRELLLVLKDLVEVHKVNTQALLDIKKVVGSA